MVFKETDVAVFFRPGTEIMLRANRLRDEVGLRAVNVVQNVIGLRCCHLDSAS